MSSQRAAECRICVHNRRRRPKRRGLRERAVPKRQECRKPCPVKSLAEPTKRTGSRQSQPSVRNLPREGIPRTGNAEAGVDAVDDAVDVGMGAVMAVSEMRSRAQQRLSWKVLRNLRLPLLAPQNR